MSDHHMAKMHRPKVEPPLVPDVPDADIRKLLKACEGKAFEAKRDMAILRVFLDTGLRLAECTGIRVDDVDFDHGVIYVMGKGRKPRSLPFGPKTSQALDQYRRLRIRHPQAQLTQLWSVRAARSAAGASPRCCSTAATTPESAGSTLTSPCGTPPPTCGWPTAARKAT